MNIFLSPRHSSMLIAHRGASSDRPENSMAAFSAAVEVGADGFELDVQLSADRKLVVMHDRSVNRTTNGQGRVNKLSLSQLTQLDIGGHEAVPSLSQVLDDFGTQAGIIVEMKNYMNWRNGLEAEVARLILSKNVQNNVLFATFLPWGAKKVRKIIPEAATCVFYLRGLGWLLRPWQRYISVYGPSCRHLSKHSVTRIHQRGKLVNTWTAKTTAEIKRLKQLGVNIITSDVVDIN